MNTTSYQEEDTNPDANAEEQEKNQDCNEQPLFLREDWTFFSDFFVWPATMGIAYCPLPSGQAQTRTKVIDCLYRLILLFTCIDCFANENDIIYSLWS